MCHSTSECIYHFDLGDSTSVHMSNHSLFFELNSGGSLVLFINLPQVNLVNGRTFHSWVLVEFDLRRYIGFIIIPGGW